MKTPTTHWNVAVNVEKAGDRCLCAFPGGKVLAWLPHSAEITPEEKIMRAAPEMLEFLKGIDEIIRMGKPSDVLWNYCVEQRGEILAKATE